jgi:hypothetical protein
LHDLILKTAGRRLVAEVELSPLSDVLDDLATREAQA